MGTLCTKRRLKRTPLLIINLIKTCRENYLNWKTRGKVNFTSTGSPFCLPGSHCGDIDMTLTAPNCPAADFMMEDVRMKVESVEGVKSLELNLVFEPEWSHDLMTEEAKLELGLL